MMEKDKFEKELTEDDIKDEIDKLEDFFKQIPDNLKSEAAIDIIFNAALWGSFELTHGLGVIEEAKFRFREILTRDINE